MKRLKAILVSSGLLTIIVSCTYQSVSPRKEVNFSNGDYFVFGHNQGFCMNCDEVYKIEGEELYGANNQFISDPDNVTLTLFSSPSYRLVKDLSSKIPAQLLQGNPNEVQTIGTMAPDAGHYYFKIKSNGVVHRWYVEMNNTPDYLTDFLSEVRDAMDKLR